MLLHSPDIANSIEKFKTSLTNKTHIAYNEMDNDIKNIYLSLPKISIDYALMEKSQNVSVCKAIFSWDDIGAWDSLDRTKQKDTNGNVLQGKTSIINCNNSIIINECKEKNIILAGLGLDDIVVITTDDAVMVCPKSQVQNIKNIVDDVRSKFGEEHL
jgi:mannose-1-phosphate guanylyltransferase